MATACALARRRLLDKVQSAAGVSSKTDRTVTAVKAGFFGSVPTLGRATIGNAANISLRQLWEAPTAAAVDYVRSVAQSALSGFKVSPDELRTVLMPGIAEYRASLRGFQKGAQPFVRATRALKPGSPFGERFAGFVDELRVQLDADDVMRQSLDQMSRTQYRSRTAQAVTDGVFAVLEAVDRPTWQAAHDFSLVQQARLYAEREIPKAAKNRRAAVSAAIQRYIDAPTDAMIVRAIEDANFTTFKNETALSKMAQEAKRVLRTRADLPGAGGRLANMAFVGAEILAPATRVPSSVAAQAAAYTPLGFVKAAAALMGKDGPDYHAFAQAMAQGSFGTAGLLLGVQGLKDGWLTGGMPASSGERARWREEGRKPYAIRIGDQWLSYGYLGPLAAGIAAGATVAQAGEDASGTASTTERVAAGAVAPLNYLSEQTYMEGFRRLLDAIERPGNRGAALVGGMVPVPAIVRQTARALDPIERDTDNLAHHILRSIPGASTMLPAKQRAYGDDAPASTAQRIAALLSPSTISSARDNRVTQGLRDADVSLTGFQNVLTLRGERHRLSRETVRRMTATYRELVQQHIAPILDDPEFAALPADVRHKVMTAQLRRLRDLTRVRAGLPALEASLDEAGVDTDAARSPQPIRPTSSAQPLPQSFFEAFVDFAASQAARA